MENLWNKTKLKLKIKKIFETKQKSSEKFLTFSIWNKDTIPLLCGDSQAWLPPQTGNRISALRKTTYLEKYRGRVSG